MKLTTNRGENPVLTTTIYQGKNGGIYINFSPKPILLDRQAASEYGYDTQDFDIDDFNNFYNKK